MKMNMYPARTYSLFLRAAKSVFPSLDSNERAAVVSEIEDNDDSLTVPAVFCVSDAELHIRALIDQGELRHWASSL